MKTHTINGVVWTEEQMRVAIAEAHGWKWHEVTPGGFSWRIPDGFLQSTRWWCKKGEFTTLETLPDYLNDLNAMREAERVVHEAGLWRSYVNWLKDICGEPQTEAYSCQTHVGADAPQRAIAFIQTMKLKPE